jgi:outer membrane protein assembly factor BamB
MRAFLILLLLPSSSAVAGLETVWRSKGNQGNGAPRVSAAGDAIVFQVQGGDTTVLDAATGARRTTLIDSRAAGDEPIYKYAKTARVLHGALLGPNRLELSAIDLATGKLRWRRAVAGLTSPRNDHALRDTLSAVEAGALDIVAFRHLESRTRDSWHWEETLAALDPKDGRERWRRTVTRWPENTPIGDRDGLVLAADGDRAIVVKPGRLEAFDAETGAPRWNRPWGKPLAPAFSPGRIALAEAGSTVVHVLDASDGQEVAALPSSKGVLESVFLLEAIVCTTSAADDQGHAACYALEQGRARPLWQRQFPLAFTQALADGQSLFVTVGGERLVTLDARSGAERSIANFPRWTQLWMANDAKGRGRLFVVEEGTLTAVAPGGDAPAPLPGYLHFRLRAAKNGACSLAAAEWIDGDGRRSWSSPLPPRLRGSRGSCAEYELAMYRRSPRHAGIPGLATLEARGTLWLFDHGGLLALDPRSGKILLDATAANRPLGEAFFFDSGSFTWGSCSGGAPHAQVFEVCDDSLLYFNGSTALLVDLATRRVKARAPYVSGTSVSGGRAAREQTRIPLGGKTLELDGITHMR